MQRHSTSVSVCSGSGQLTGRGDGEEVALESAEVDPSWRVLAGRRGRHVHLVEHRAAHAVFLAPHLQRDDTTILSSREEVDGIPRILHKRDNGHVDGRRSRPLRLGCRRHLRLLALGLAVRIRIDVLHDDRVCQQCTPLSPSTRHRCPAARLRCLSSFPLPYSRTCTPKCLQASGGGDTANVHRRNWPSWPLCSPFAAMAEHASGGRRGLWPRSRSSKEGASKTSGQGQQA